MENRTTVEDILQLKEQYNLMWVRLSADAISRLKENPQKYNDFTDKDLPLIKSAIAMCDGILGFMSKKQINP